MAERDRVLFVAPLPPPVTGQALACATLLQALQERGRVEVINTMKGHYRQGFTSLFHAFRTLGFAWRLRRLAPRARAIYLNPSQTIAGNLKDLLLFLALGRHLRRTVLHLHGGGIRKMVYDRHPLLHRLNRIALSRLQAAVVLGDSLRGVFAGLVPEERIRVVRNYAPAELFLSPAEVAAKGADRERPLQVLFMSNLFRSKGPFDLLAAAEEAHRRGRRDLRFLFAGGEVDPEEGREFRSRVEALPTATYLGFLEGAAQRRVLAETDVLALPSYYPYEGQPLCILEAYAAGCAVVTTAQGGIGDIFADGRNGLQVPARDPDALLAALLALAEDRDRLAECGLRNRKEAEAFREDRFTEALARILEP